ncbi:MFS transporter [Desulfovibrio desulfuricans]|uniref:MFS transporter n=1 Tax=Desulfovibrio desulfuricans TaxID=876 RepID=UPI001AE424DB|nr:MFS transporter [Desulfovibrio desulfuricans]MDD3682787.1 MFS transporter [Desulfovibrio desulfuricans]QTO39554.1 MFS transporter [Desulfovibrio desulfuricans]
MLIRATRKLRINALLLGLGVLLVTLGFNVLLSVSTLNTLATDMVLSGYRSGAERLARDIERGMRFGKPLASFAGMDEMLAELGQSAAGIKRVTIIDARGSTLYVQPAQDSKADSTLPSGATSQTSEDKDGPQGAIKTADGYRLSIPLNNKTPVGHLLVDIDGKPINAATEDFLRLSSLLLAAACLVAGLILAGRLGLLTGQRAVGTSLSGMTRMLLVIIGTSQLLYACGTLVLFDTFVKQAVRTKADILAEGTGRDFEYLIHKGVDIASLRGKDQALEQLLAANSELAGAQLLTPEGKAVASAGHVPDTTLTVEKSLSTYWPSRFRQKQEVLRLQLAVQPQAITTRISALALDLGASLLISFLLLLELSKLLGLIAQRNLPPDAAANVLGGSHHSLAVQALRAAGFVFFLGYDMGISFIPLLARQLYEPFMGLSRDVAIGLPISAEMVSAGIALLFSGGFSLRYGWRKVFAAGTLAAAVGLMMGGMANSLHLLILGRVATGFGFGLVLMAGQIGTLGKANAGAGLTSVFAGIFSGSICGSAAGAMLADHVSFQAVLATGACTILLALFTVMLGKEPAEAAASSSDSAVGQDSGAQTAAHGHMFSGCMQLLQDPRMHMILWLVGIPAAMCLTGFLHYLLPLRLANAHVDQSDIGRIFMLYGLCFITAGPLLGKWIDHRKDKSLFLTLTGLLSGITLLIAATATNMAGAATAVISLGLAQCLAAPASMICVLTLASAQTLGREKTASIYRGLERMGQVAGPVVFGIAITVMAPASALLLMGGIVCALSLLFHLLWRLRTPAN